jgi:hypothetical protein
MHNDWRDETDPIARQEAVEKAIQSDNPEEMSKHFIADESDILDYKGAEHLLQTQKLIREVIYAIAGVQNVSHAYLEGGRMSVRPEMETIKSDADLARKKIRELAQHIGIEY